MQGVSLPDPDDEGEDDPNGPSEVVDTAERVYPPTRPALSWTIPQTIRASHDEARRCLDGGNYVATALMCRRTLEIFCKEQKAPGRTLYDMLKNLHKAGQIEGRLKEWADALREDGNLAAHGVAETIDQRQAKDLVDFTEAFLDYVFVLTKRFDAFRERRAKVREQKEKPDPS